MSKAWRSIVLLATLVMSPAIAGEIPGLAPQLPPYHERDLEISFSNDFLGRGGSVDDFRTQQFTVSAKLSGRWLAVLDHSILTLDDGIDTGRADQLSASFGYQLINRNATGRTDTLIAGLGLRSSGDFAGDRIQNGFHRLIGSEIETLPYPDASSTDVTAWVDANHYRRLRASGDAGLLTSWERGIWLRAGSLLTSDGQWDGTTALLAVARRPSIDLWLGVRSDWRSGYDDVVLRETAAAEEDVALTLGVRFGPVVIETVQQRDNDASYGQLRLVSTGHRHSAAAAHGDRFELDFAVVLPDVHMRLAGKYPKRIFGSEGGAWRQSLLVAASYGEPQYGSNTRLFVRSGQLDIGLEFERPWSGRAEWLSIYATTTAGWREQKLIALSAAQEQQSTGAGRAIATFSAGFRFNAAGTENRSGFRIQTGVVAALPLSGASLAVEGQSYRVQKSSINLTLGFAASFD